MGDAKTLIITLVVGGVAGWLAGLIVRGYGLGLLWNIIVGVIGGFFGAWVLRELGVGFGGGIPGALLTGLIGAVLLLLLFGLLVRQGVIRRR